MKAPITGITGQDGSYLAELLVGKGYAVHEIKRRAPSPKSNFQFWLLRSIGMYNTVKSHSSFDYKPPAPQSINPTANTLVMSPVVTTQ